jgi:hypothetical protein
MEEFAVAFPVPLACATGKIAGGIDWNQGRVTECVPLPVCTDSVPARQVLPERSVTSKRRIAPESSRRGSLS